MIPTRLVVKRVGESAQFTCVVFSNSKAKQVEWYWNNSLANATFYNSDHIIVKSSYQIHYITHVHAGVYECRVSYLVAHRKVFTVSALGQLVVAGICVKKN